MLLSQMSCSECGTNMSKKLKKTAEVVAGSVTTDHMRSTRVLRASEMVYSLKISDCL